MTFASDPVSSVITRPKITKEQQQQLFYSSDDYDKFDYHSIQAHQELKQEWERGVVSVADPSAEVLQPIAKITYANDLESVIGELPCHLAPSIICDHDTISDHDPHMPKAATDTCLAEFPVVASVDTFEDQQADLLATIAKGTKDTVKRNSLWRIILQLDSFTTLRLQSTVRGYLQQKRRTRMTACVVSIQSAARMFNSKHALQELRNAAASTKLQSAWRASVQFNTFIKVVANIQIVQSSVRVYIRRSLVVQCPFAPQKVFVQCGPSTSLPAPRTLDFVQCPFAPHKVIQCGPLKPLIHLSAPIAFDFHDDPMDVGELDTDHDGGISSDSVDESEEKVEKGQFSEIISPTDEGGSTEQNELDTDQDGVSSSDSVDESGEEVENEEFEKPDKPRQRTGGGWISKFTIEFAEHVAETKNPHIPRRNHRLSTRATTIKSLQNAGKLDANHVKALDALGFIWDQHAYAWDLHYTLAKKYHEGKKLKPEEIKQTKNWIQKQQRNDRKKTAEQIKRLEKIGVKFYKPKTY